MLPKKILGFWWSRWHPYSEKDVQILIHRFEKEQMPLSVLVLDMDWHKDGWRHWDWDLSLIPDPQKLIRWLHKKGLLLTLNVHPHEILKTDSHFDEYCKRSKISPEKDKDRVMTNLVDPLQRKAYEDLLIVPFHKTGLDFWWIDGDAARLGSCLKPQFWTNKVFFDAAAKSLKSSRPLIFSRAGGFGNQRYPVGFSGDTLSEWHVLKYLVPFTASGGNFGFHYWSNDTGGFWGEHLPDDLYIRWFQFSALSPILRMHCSHGDREPWSYNHHAAHIARDFYKLRRRLLPYLYTLMRQCSQYNIPMCRPLYLEFTEDPNAYEHPEEYFLGSDLLCPPVFEPRVSGGGVRSVYFPEGIWWDWFTGDVFQCPAVRRVASPLSRIPLYVRAGAILPLLPEKEDAKTLEFHVFSGASGRGYIYDDDGETGTHGKGHFAEMETRFFRDGNSMVFEADPWKGKFAPNVNEKNRILILHTPKADVRRKLESLPKGKPVKKVITQKKLDRDLRERLVKSDLVRRMRVARILEEQIGSPLDVLLEYDHLLGKKTASSGIIVSFMKRRLDRLYDKPPALPDNTYESLVRELLGIHVQLALSDSGTPDILHLNARICPPVEYQKGFWVDLEWNIPGDWSCAKAVGFRQRPLNRAQILSSEINIHSPRSSHPLGEAAFGARIALFAGKQKFLFFPGVSLDLSSIREAWFIGPFDSSDKGMEKEFGPEKEFNPKVSFRGKYGAVSWRHFRIPIDGRDVWSNFSTFDIRQILETGEKDEIAFMYFRVHSERKNRFNFVSRIDEPAQLTLNGKTRISLQAYNNINQINLEKGDNELLFKMQRTWGEWDIRLGIVSFANNGTAEGLTVASL
jgi:hypothetical protein